MGKRPFRELVAIFILILSVTTVSCGTGRIDSVRNGSMENGKKTDRPAESRITLKLWHVWPTYSESNKKPLENALEKWNRENPGVRVVAEATENEAYKLKIRSAVAVNEAPDIFYCWGAGFAKPFVEAQKVLALDEYINDGTREKLVPGSLDYFTYNGKVYGLPVFIIAGVLYCNRELFDRYGLQLPVTFDDLLRDVKVFKSKGIIPMAVGEKDGWPGMFYQNVLAIRTAGVDLCNRALNKQESFSRAEFAESVSRLQELIKAGAFDERCMNLTRDEAEADFKNGKAAMYFSRSWVAGSLDSEDCPVKGKISVINFPKITGAAGDANGFVGGSIDTFMISANTKYKAEAARALKAIDEDFCRESYSSGATEPAWKLEKGIARQKTLEAGISDLLKNNTGFVLAWDTILTAPEAEVHINLVADVFAGRCTPENFAKEMQKLNEAGIQAQ